jgi:cobalt-zinc-cadmium efflux system outer membrane protein
MTTRVTAAFLVTSGLAVSGAAQTGQSVPGAGTFVDAAAGISLEQAIVRALAQEPSIRAARTAVEAARGMQLQAGLRRNPSLSMELRGEPAGADNQTVVGVEWPLELFRRRGRVGVAEREVAAAELTVADRERVLASEVRARFGEVLAAVRDLALAEELVETARQQFDVLRSRVGEGASPPLDRDLLDVELRRLDADRVLQLGRAERAMFELKRTLGAAPGDPLRLRDTLEDVVNREMTAAMTAPDAAARRADVREAEARIAVADAKIDRARREGRFDVSLFGGYMRMDAGFPQLGLSAAGTPERIHGLFHYVTGGAMVTMPLLNRNEGEMAIAQAERAGAVALQEAARLSAEIEISTARTLDRRAHEAVQLYSQSARALARQNLSVVRQSYELGRTTIFEVLDQQKRYLDLERAYTETLRAAYQARTALNQALGVMP